MITSEVEDLKKRLHDSVESFVVSFMREYDHAIKSGVRPADSLVILGCSDLADDTSYDILHNELCHFSAVYADEEVVSFDQTLKEVMDQSTGLTEELLVLRSYLESGGFKPSLTDYTRSTYLSKLEGDEVFLLWANHRAWLVEYSAWLVYSFLMQRIKQEQLKRI